LTLGPKPNYSWGSSKSDAPPSESAPGGPTPAPIPIPNPADSLALKKAVTISSSWGKDYAGSYAVDGNKLTSWCTQGGPSTGWIYVDLGSTKSIDRVILYWGSWYMPSYKIQLSDDAISWTDVYSTGTRGGTDDLKKLSGKGRYVRLQQVGKGGCGLSEFEVYGK